MLLIKVNGQFALIDPITMTDLHPNRPMVVTRTRFVELQASNGRISILDTELPEGATDAGWVEFYKASEGDLPLAIASFKSSFLPEAETPAPTGRRGRRGA